MEPVFFLLGALLVLGAIVGPILGYMASQRARALAHRVRTLESKVRALSEEARASDAPERGELVKPDWPSPPEEEHPEDGLVVGPEEPCEEHSSGVALPDAGSDREQALDVLDPAEEDPTPGNISVSRGRTREKKTIDLERWLGLRGAALAGGAVLILSGLLFLQYAIQHGWVGPWTRVLTSSGLGVVLLALRTRIARATSSHLGDVLAGAGAALLYGSSWAAWVLYDLVPFPASMLVMFATTIAVCVIALRHSSVVMAGMATAGGFATPFLLQSSGMGALPLFSYLFVLDVTLLMIARRLRCAPLAISALAGTTVLQAIWFATQLDSGGSGTFLVALFAIVFGMSPLPEGRWSGVLRHLSLVSSGGLALWLVGTTLFGVTMGQLAPLLLLLQAMSLPLARLRRQTPLMAAIAGLGIGAIWLSSQFVGDGVGSFALLALGTLGLMALHAVFGTEEELQGFPQQSFSAFVVAAIAAQLVLAVEVSTHAVLGSYVAACSFMGVTLALSRGVLRSPSQVWVLWPVALAAGLVLASPLPNAVRLQGPAGGILDWLPPLLATILTSLALLDAWRSNRKEQRARFLVPVLLALPAAAAGRADLAALVWAMPLLGLAALGSVRSRDVRTVLATTLTSTFLAARASHLALLEGAGSAGILLVILALPILVACVVLTNPEQAWQGKGHAGRAALVAAPLVFSPWFHDLAEGVCPVPPASLFVALSTALVAATARWGSTGKGTREQTVGIALADGIAVVFAVLAAARWIGPSWGAVAGTVSGALLVELGRRRSSPWLREFGIVVALLFGAGTLLGSILPGAFPREDSWLAPWLAYALLVPVGSLLFVLRRLQPGESRQATTAGLLVIGLVFVWLNLVVLNGWGTGSRVGIGFDGRPGRDLTQSLLWAAYSVALLVLGSKRNLRGLRWTSLVLALATASKVFLNDLGSLEGLYRVASTAGLALSLLFISVLYHRVVFGSRSATSELHEDAEESS